MIYFLLFSFLLVLQLHAMDSSSSSSSSLFSKNQLNNDDELSKLFGSLNITNTTKQYISNSNEEEAQEQITNVVNKEETPKKVLDPEFLNQYMKALWESKNKTEGISISVNTTQKKNNSKNSDTKKQVPQSHQPSVLDSNLVKFETARQIFQLNNTQQKKETKKRKRQSSSSSSGSEKKRN